MDLDLSHRVSFFLFFLFFLGFVNIGFTVICHCLWLSVCCIENHLLWSLHLLCLSSCMAIQGDNMSLSDAIEATEHLTLRDLPQHVHVGPLPIGSVTPSTLPLKELLVLHSCIS